MYDLDGDDMISKEELYVVLTQLVGNDISKEHLHLVVERTMLEADVEKNNCITFDEYYKILENTDVGIKMSIKV